MLKRTILALLLVGSAGVGNVPSSAADRIDADVLLKGGSLHIGNGRVAAVGDVAIKDGRIVGVGKFQPGNVVQVIDCRGLMVSPGFVDLHNHSDRQVLDKKTRSVINYLTQGCTTIVTGNCGSGPIRVGEYYDDIDRMGAGVNVAHLLPQGNLRREVMGSERRAASAEQLDQMAKLAEKAMAEGAWGMSTGLIYVPSSYADTDELVGLAKVVGRHGGIYVSHIRGEGLTLLNSVDEALDIGRRAELPVHISHFKSSGKDAWGMVRVASEKIERQRELGRLVTADQYPYAASSTSLDATLIPSWARAGGRKRLVERIDDKQLGPKIIATIKKNLDKADRGQRIQIASYGPHPQWAGQRLSQIAEELKIEPLELVLQIVRRGSASIVNHGMNEDDVRFVMTRPWVATASDGRAYLPAATVPHPRNYGTFPRKIGDYAIRQGVLPLEQAVRSATGLPADILGLKTRGYLRVGYHADVAVWDASKLIDTATFSRPHSYSQGVVHVFVNGSPTVVKGMPTGALSGRALRHDSDTKSTPEGMTQD